MRALRRFWRMTSFYVKSLFKKLLLKRFNHARLGFYYPEAPNLTESPTR